MESMVSSDAAALANAAMQLGLLTSRQVDEAWDELGARNGPAEKFLRCMERKQYLTPFQTNKLIRGDKNGYILGGYQLLYKIASGSFGRVYRAVEPGTGSQVAIKILRKKWSVDKHKIELFVREGRMGMTLRHPNIVEILAVNHEKSSNQYYIVMEFVEGGNLRDILNIRKTLQPAEMLRILEDIAAGLAAAFAHGTTHRDMKLTNVLLASQGHAKLVDFGLAGVHAGHAAIAATVAASTAGADDDKDEVDVDRTVDYAGLEKATNAPHGDPRSDLFFVGCVAYELLTGKSPLDTKRGAEARMSAQRFLKLASFKAEQLDVPVSVGRVVESLLTLNPDLRIQTPSQLVDRVRECRRELGGVSQPGESAKAKAQTTIFLAESDETLQDALREKLKKQGFRVLIAADPVRALERFRQQPFDLLIVDAATTGETGYYVFESILEDARRQNIPCKGILMLGPEQTPFQKKLADTPGVACLIQPIKYKQLLASIRELLGYTDAE